jgi:type IV pilus assembly protein PilN
MIKINLLPGSRAQTGPKQLDVRLEAGAAVILVALTVVACLYYSGILDAEIEAKQQEKQDKEKHLAVLKEKIKKVEDFDQLEKSRGGPVRVMDFVSQSLDPLKLWLVSMSVKGNEVELDGRALTNDDVVEFVNNLRRTEFFGAIRLAETRSSAEGKTNVFHFKLHLTLKG